MYRLQQYAYPIAPFRRVGYSIGLVVGWSVSPFVVQPSTSVCFSKKSALGARVSSSPGFVSVLIALVEAKVKSRLSRRSVAPENKEENECWFGCLSVCLTISLCVGLSLGGEKLL